MSRLIVITLMFFNGLCMAQNTAKPWTYWWWMGSAVDEKNIEAQLKKISAAGIGGVHIIPIYGVKGYEKSFVPFLSKRWIELLDFTVATAKREGLGVDMTTGTGWPFGGPSISEKETSHRFVIERNQFSSQPVGQKVKRAAPGGTGLVVDPFSARAMKKYLQRFDSVFAFSSHGIRSMYCDSYEAYAANWTDDFEEEFLRRRGYQLRDHLNAFTDSAGTTESLLAKIDYHQTIAELLEETMKVWTGWSGVHNFLTRYQAHGSPGNLLDLYSLAAIPETESFGSSNFPIPHLRVDATYNEKNFGRPDLLAMKFASSAAHVNGKKLISAETGTWLADHFTVSLAQVKPQIDQLFAAGINHVFYHGTTYSPQHEKSPGWLFYASTNFGPTSSFWPQLPELNRYVERCQEILQTSAPDNDVLLYFPMSDVWTTNTTSPGGVHQLDVHHTERWLSNTAFGQTAKAMTDMGFAIDYVSDKQLQAFSMINGALKNGVASYKALVVPLCSFMPIATLEKIEALASKGVRVFFLKDFPASATGWLNNGKATDRMSLIKSSLQKLSNVSVINSVAEIRDVNREEWVSDGINFLRKKSGNGSIYFIANLGASTFRQVIKLSKSNSSISQFNPTTNEKRGLHVGADGSFTLLLEPGESCFLLPDVKSLKPLEPFSQTLPLDGRWHVSFTNGNPRIGLSRTVDRLDSWTTWCDSCQYFSGSVVYGKSFNMPPALDRKKNVRIDFDEVNDVAEVYVNGKPVGVAWCIPYSVTFPGKILRNGINTVEVKVANSASNYFRLYDQRHPEWKKFYDINFVNIEYKPYEGAKVKTIDAGLVGGVTLHYTAVGQ